MKGSGGGSPSRAAGLLTARYEVGQAALAPASQARRQDNQSASSGRRPGANPGSFFYEDPVQVWEGVRDATVRAQDLSGRGALREITEEEKDILATRAARDPAERLVGTGAQAAAEILKEQQDIAESPLRIHVRVPASCANLGSGFDCLGLAVNIWNDVIVEEEEKQEIILHGEGENELPRDNSNLVVCGFYAVLARLQLTASKLPKFRFTCYNRIPVARGLGSSCAALVSGILASTALAPFLQRRCAGDDVRIQEGKRKDSGERDAALFAMEGEWLHQAGLAVEVCDEKFLLKIACDLEGHADNAAAALFGGLQLALQYVPRDPMTVLATIEKTHYPTPFDIKAAKEAAKAVAAAGGAVSPLPGAEKNAAVSLRPRGKDGGKGEKTRKLTDGDSWLARGIPIPANLKCVLFVPDDRLETAQAREVLPRTVPLADAVFNSSRTALLTYAMSTAAAASVVAEAGDGGTPAKAADAAENVLYRLLQEAMDDRLHQNYRKKLNPHFEPIMEAAQRAGALGVCLSGAGPSVLAFTMEHHAGEIAEAIKQAAAECKKEGLVLVVDPTSEGAHTVHFARERDDDGW
ncbi:putative GHMP kinase [Besnoitia besnoiti]|uniref:Putative GHMP kinase n=1 Tax=Besnoitia besnoiti TaxID=94643 RepID=A0A2A9M9U4_BESBE|nr:putative GHMP kinase [Besnoitia besnoiti]PFH34765.1 putative GHMP kinase [Besnoitia besnoiti]